MQHKAKIALLYPYFGELPSLFPLWLKSCSYNSEIDYLIYTDQDVGCVDAVNIFITKMTFSEFKTIVQSNFEFKISLDNPYKICDFRPAFGDIFKAELEGYTHWGYGDMDLIWGNFSAFITLEILNRYEKILRCGHLTIYKNIEKTNFLYNNDYNGDFPYVNIFKTIENCTFDEWWGEIGIGDMAKKYGVLEYNEICFADVQRMYRKRSLCFDFALNFEKPHGEKQLIFFWSKGHLYSILRSKNGDKEEKEILYAHFQKRNINVGIKAIPDEFYIVPNKIVLPPEKEAWEYFMSSEYRRNYSCELKKFQEYRSREPEKF